MTEDEKDAMKSLDQLIDESMPRPEGKEDWAYRDMYSWLRADFWSDFLGILGEENYMLLATSERRSPTDNQMYHRGQFLISPTGMNRLRAHNASQPTPPTKDTKH